MIKFRPIRAAVRTCGVPAAQPGARRPYLAPHYFWRLWCGALGFLQSDCPVQHPPRLGQDACPRGFTLYGCIPVYPMIAYRLMVLDHGDWPMCPIAHFLCVCVSVDFRSFQRHINLQVNASPAKILGVRVTLGAVEIPCSFVSGLEVCRGRLCT